MRVLIVTAANDPFVSVVSGLFKSLHRLRPQLNFELACLDVGLNEVSRGLLSAYGVIFCIPGWDLPVRAETQLAQPHLRALTARPFLRDYFPGFDAYVWIDTDAWVQESFALDYLIRAIRDGAFCAVAECADAYKVGPEILGWRRRRWVQAYGEEVLTRLPDPVYCNGGVFSLSDNSPFWGAWAHSFRQGLDHSEGLLCCDQSALNHALSQTEIPRRILGARFNWLCHLAMPHWNAARQRFTEPHRPDAILGILHMSADTKRHDGSTQIAGAPSSGLHFPRELLT